MKKVSVLVITYKHEKYIGQALDSIVSQKANFEFEVVIGEDFSPDGTRAVCEQYAAKYPGLIRLLPSEHNHGAINNLLRTLRECKGEYVAICEGDDYWIDDHKLQKQVDFMDAHPDFTTCFTGVQIHDEMGWKQPDEYFFPKCEKDVYEMEDFITSEMNIIPTPTILFRNILPNPMPDFFLQALVGDMGTQLFLADI